MYECGSRGTQLNPRHLGISYCKCNIFCPLRWKLQGDSPQVYVIDFQSLPLLLSCTHLGQFMSLSCPQCPWFAASRGTSLFSTTFPFLCFPFRSVSKLMKLIDKGVLPQDVKPPEDILLLPTMDYLDWINNLPGHLQHQVIHFSPSCSIKAQKEKVCLLGAGGCFPTAPEATGKCISQGPCGLSTYLLRQVTELLFHHHLVCARAFAKFSL